MEVTAAKIRVDGIDLFDEVSGHGDPLVPLMMGSAPLRWPAPEPL